MTIQTVPLSSILPPKGNPRTTYDTSSIEGLAESIRTDGVLQNLVVRPHRNGKFRVVSGSRRLRALKLLKELGAIEGSYQVPVEIKEDLADADALRIATVENVQRAPLDPVDEAEAFAALVQRGVGLADVAAQMGVSELTVKRRLALANLCAEAKDSLRNGETTLSIAETLTLASHSQQQTIIGEMKAGAEYDQNELRDLLLSEKPSLAMAIFNPEQYSGNLTSDLFAEAETTYFDDIDQFFELQRRAVDLLAEEHRKTAAWVEVINVYSVPWWQYREATEGEPAGVVINLAPTGRVEVREGLVRHEVQRQAVEDTRETPAAPRPQREYTDVLLRYMKAHKTLAVQACLLDHPRKGKEVAALELLLAYSGRSRIRLDPHPSLSLFDKSISPPVALRIVQQKVQPLARKLGWNLDDVGDHSSLTWQWLQQSDQETRDLYAAIQTLTDQELDALQTLLVVLCFGLDLADVDSGTAELFDRIGRDLGLDMRRFWRPDEAFLSGHRRSQLEAIAIDSGASMRLGRFREYSKNELVKAMVRYFERTADASATLDEYDQKGRDWLPQAMGFSASADSAPQEAGK